MILRDDMEGREEHRRRPEQQTCRGNERRGERTKFKKSLNVHVQQQFKGYIGLVSESYCEEVRSINYSLVQNNKSIFL